MSGGSAPDPTRRAQLPAVLTLSDTAMTPQVSAHATTTAVFMGSNCMFVIVPMRGGWRCSGMHSIGCTSGMASGSQGGDARLTIGDRAGQWWPVTVTSIAATRSGDSLATPLLRNEEGILHPLQLLHLGIGIVVNTRHGDCQSLYLRASWMLSEIVGSGPRQKLRTTKGGTTATQATTIQFGTDVIPIASAARKTAIDQAMNNSVLVFLENMSRV